MLPNLSGRASAVGDADRGDPVGPCADDVMLAVADHREGFGRGVGVAIESLTDERRLIAVREVQVRADDLREKAVDPEVRGDRHGEVRRFRGDDVEDLAALAQRPEQGRYAVEEQILVHPLTGEIVAIRLHRAPDLGLIEAVAGRERAVKRWADEWAEVRQRLLDAKLRQRELHRFGDPLR